MALHWSWAFGNETGTNLNSMGWTSSHPTDTTQNVAHSDSDKVYSYTGSPTRYSWGLRFSASLTMASAAFSGVNSGWIAVPFKSGEAAASYSGGYLIYGQTSGSRIIGVDVQSTGVMRVFVNSFVVATTAAYDFSSWKYVALLYDLTGAYGATTHAAQLYVDGVAATTLATSTRAAETLALVRFNGGLARNAFPSTSLTSHYIGQCTIWNSRLDTQAADPVFVTRVEPTSDGTNVGTWTPSTGSDDFAVVDSPFDATTYTQDASPSASDRCEVVSSALSTALGITPSSITGATAHTYSQGQSVTAKAVVGPSGGAETSGTSTAIGASTTTYAMATSTASLSASDTIDIIYEIVSP